MKKYQIIYADPPWSYRSGKVQGAAQNHYQTMSDEQLYQLPVADLTAEDCALFLWCTFPKLPEAIKLISAWGFSFKTVAFVWVKQNKSGNGFFMGLGWWTRSNAEICLLAVKGKPRRKSAGVRQLILSPVEQHSKKPDVVRDNIVTLMGDLPRIELFARQSTPGWDVWGMKWTALFHSHKGGGYDGLCTRTQRFNQSQNQGHVQSDPKAAGLLYRRGACRRTAVLFAP